MKHTPIIISKQELLIDAITYNQGDIYEEFENATDGYYVVTWPEHVQTPRINGDATIGFVGATLEEVAQKFPESGKYSRALYGDELRQAFPELYSSNTKGFLNTIQIERDWFERLENDFLMFSRYERDGEAVIVRYSQGNPDRAVKVIAFRHKRERNKCYDDCMLKMMAIISGGKEPLIVRG